MEDPLSFVLDALEAEGALYERQGDRANALLPSPVAGRLGLAEASELAAYPEPGCVPCGLGAPVLEKLVAEARARLPVVNLRLDIEPPRLAHARAIAERFVLRNGVVEVEQVLPGTGTYVVAHVAFVAEADDRHEGMVSVVVQADSGGVPAADLAGLLELAWPDTRLRPSPTALHPGQSARFIAARANRAVAAATAPMLREVERRHTRDHERIARYYADLVTEAAAPRRRADAAAVEAKVQHLLAERDAKLRDLPTRFALRVRQIPAALALVALPIATATLTLRRRKATRQVSLHVPAGSQSADQLACDGCLGATAQPAACDDRLHLLCEVCAPSAQGRIACPACRKG